MKLSKAQLKEMVRKAIQKRLDEQTDLSDKVPQEVTEYAKKVDDFLKETITRAQELHDEGEEMMRPSNMDMGYETQERNRFILYRVGFLNTLVSNLLHRLEDQNRQ